MSCIVKSRRPNGVVYLYESTSVWDSAKKMSIPKRRLIGKLDPETGETIPTGKRGNRRSGATRGAEQLASKASSTSKDVRTIQETVAEQQKQCEAALAQVRNDLVRMQTLKVELKRTEATLDALIKAIQPLV